MPLTIKNVEAERLAAEVAKLTDTSLTQAVIQSLRERRERLLQQRAKHKGVAQAREFLKREFWERPQLHDTTRDEDILGYGESGA